MFFTVLVVCLISSVFSQKLVPSTDEPETNAECNTKALVQVLNNLLDVLIKDHFSINESNPEVLQRTIVDFLKSYLNESPSSANLEILNKLTNFEKLLQLKDHAPETYNDASTSRTIAVRYKSNLPQDKRKKHCKEAFDMFLKLAYTAYKQLQDDPICGSDTWTEVQQVVKSPALFKDTPLPYLYDGSKFVKPAATFVNPYSSNRPDYYGHQYASYGRPNAPTAVNQYALYGHQNIPSSVNTYGLNGKQYDPSSYDNLNYKIFGKNAPKAFTARPKPKKVDGEQSTVNINNFLQGDLKANVEHAKAIVDWYKENDDSSPSYDKPYNKPDEGVDLTKRIMIKEVSGNIKSNVVPGTDSKKVVSSSVKLPKNYYDSADLLPQKKPGPYSYNYLTRDTKKSFQPNIQSKNGLDTDERSPYGDTQNKLNLYEYPKPNLISSGWRLSEVQSSPSVRLPHWYGFSDPNNLRDISTPISDYGHYDELGNPAGIQHGLLEDYDIPNLSNDLPRHYGSYNYLPSKVPGNSQQYSQSYNTDQILTKIGFPKLRFPQNKYHLNVENYSPEANLNSKNLSSEIENVKHSYQSGVSNQNKLNSGGVIELTYVLRPKSLVYQPLNLVKYRLPYLEFLVKLKKLLISKPHLLNDSKKLYHELLTGASEAELTSSVGDVTKEKLYALTDQNGELVSTKIVNDNQSPDDLLKLLVESNSNVPSANVLQYIDDLISYVDGKVDRPPVFHQTQVSHKNLRAPIVDYVQYQDPDQESYGF